jgi:xanthine dehydrogenase small subunit
VAFALRLEDGVIASARIGMNGVAAMPLRALRTEEALVGQPWTEETAVDAAAVIETEGTPIDDLRATAGYRSAMLGQSVLRFYAQTTAAPALEVTR